MSLFSRLNQCASAIAPNFRSFHQTQSLDQIYLLTRLRCIDNSAIGKAAMQEGRPPKCIHVYNKTGVGKLGN